MASIYDIQHQIKVAIIIFVAIIAGISFYIISCLVADLHHEEKDKMELWANATELIVTAEPNCDLSFAQEVIAGNTTIPVLLTDSAFNVLSYRNLSDDITDPEELKELARSFARTNSVIKLDFDDGYVQYICHGDSQLLKILSYFPIILLITILLFSVMVVWVLVAIKRAEQNKVWVGMSKETAHQLGTPISSLLAWIELLSSKYPEDRMLPEMSRDTQRLRVIAERFSQIGSVPELELIDLNYLLETSLTYMRKRVSKNIELTVNIQEGDYYVMLNNHLFAWVIENLIKNAIDAIDTGVGKITFDVFKKDKTIRIDVTDTGKGMTSSVARKVFNPGFTTKKRGWGLGLSLARRIVEEYHKGKIFVKNSEPNKGTTFRIELQSID